MNEEEYTDYSCSTSGERLARDVETKLRNWHICHTDRHVSLNASSLTASTAATSTASRSSNATVTTIESSSNLRSSPSRKTSRSVHQVRLIRQEEITWARRAGTQLPLELSLWDGPWTNSTAVLSDSIEKLPHSLQRSTVERMPPVTSSFSALFGIGQHITLTPLYPEELPPLNTPQQQTPEERVSKLTCLLQTALNIAVSNVQCRIPVFGVWGHYQPNASHQMERPSITANTLASVAPSWRVIPSNHTSTVKKPRTREQSATKNPIPPPLLSGCCLAAEDDEESSANTLHTTFSCSYHPIRYERFFRKSRLTEWGSVLLKHCQDNDTAAHQPSKKLIPSKRSSDHQEGPLAVLCGARHAYMWWKPPQLKRRLFLQYVQRQEEPWRCRRSLKATNEDLFFQNDQECVLTYRRACREHARTLLEQVTGANPEEPMCGPPDDPIQTVHAVATWNGRPTRNPDAMPARVTPRSPYETPPRRAPSNASPASDKISPPQQQQHVEPLLAFPLRIRSQQTMSEEDWSEMEDTIERALLNPYQASEFSVQVTYDHNVYIAPLAASQRCVLAALIRTATLPGETLLAHLTEESLMETWDKEAGNAVAASLAERARVGVTTRQLVHAMEWTTDDMIDVYDAETLVEQNVMDGSLSLGFPSPPDEIFANPFETVQEEDTLLRPLLQSAPAGRLVSLLCLNLARVRSPPSMALVWNKFVEDLRSRWDNRDTLPNMNFVAGLDPPPELSGNDTRCRSSIGLRAPLAAFLYGSEPDPDHHHCLIGQKLQVFNLGVEILVALEIQEAERMEERRMREEAEIRKMYEASEALAAADGGLKSAKTSSTSTTRASSESVGSNGVRDAASRGSNTSVPKKGSMDGIVASSQGFPPRRGSMGSSSRMRSTLPTITQGKAPVIDFVPPAQIHAPMAFAADGQRSMSGQRSLADHSMSGRRSYADRSMSGRRSLAGSVLTQEYFDAEEGDTIAANPELYDQGSDIADGSVEDEEDLPYQTRKGARCPVHGMNLLSNGDQVYAPYLQRPYPLTDDVILSRRAMLARQAMDESQSFEATVKSRLEIAQRLQRPKLLSDMSAFKAANHGATFQDFVNWYGNPGNPLEDYNETDYNAPTPQPAEAITDSLAVKLDKASEAIFVLNATREFWNTTWEEANPVPACDQDPLFDVVSTVEMGLDYLSNIHPANLLNQVMAVNLAMSFFALVATAADTTKVPLVRDALMTLREKSEFAIKMLAHDATNGTCAMDSGDRYPPDSEHFDDDLWPEHASVVSISACEDACDALGEAEILVCRALSLLHKFPEKYELVQEMLLRADSGEAVPLLDEDSRSLILSAIYGQQKQQQQKQYSYATLPVQEDANALPVPVLREYMLRNVDESKPCQLSVRFGDESALKGESLGKEVGLLLALTKSRRE